MPIRLPSAPPPAVQIVRVTYRGVRSIRAYRANCGYCRHALGTRGAAQRGFHRRCDEHLRAYRDQLPAWRLMGYRPLLCREIGDMLGVCRERARQLCEEGIAAFRRAWERQTGTPIDRRQAVYLLRELSGTVSE